MKVYGQLEKAQIEQLAADPTGVELVTARIWYNTTDDVYRAYDGSAVSEFADLSTAQTFLNKSLTSPVVTDFIEMDQSTTPTSPAAGKNRIYFKADGTAYTLDENGNELPLGSGSGSGSKNYIEASSADIDSTIGDWVTDDGAGSASTLLTLSKSSIVGEILAGSGSLKMVKSAADADGHYMLYDTPLLDPIDKGKVLYGSFSFNHLSGYVSGDLIVEVWDITNSVVLYSGPLESVEVPASKGTFNFIAHTESTTAEVEIRLKVNNTNTNTFEVVFDEFTFGPSGAVAGVIVTEPENFTPFLGNFTLGNGSIDKANWYRDGSFMKGRFEFTFGSTSTMGTDPYILVPNSLVANTNVIGTGAESKIGDGVILDTGSRRHPVILTMLSSTIMNIRSITDNNSDAILSSTAPMTWATGDKLTFDFEVPIQGWKASNLMNTNQLHLQTSLSKYQSTSGQTLTTGSSTLIDFGTKLFDDQNLVTTGASWKYVAAKTGKLRVGAKLLFAQYSGWTTNEIGALDLRVNGALVTNLDRHTISSTSNQFLHLSGDDVIDVQKGDEIQIYATQTSGATLALYNFPGYCQVFIEAISDFTTLGVVQNNPTEYIESSQDTLTLIGGTNGQWQDKTSIVLSPGTWDIDYIGMFDEIGGNAASTVLCQVGVSATSGNTSPASVSKDRALGLFNGSAGNFLTLKGMPKRVTVSTSTTYYLKMVVDNNTNMGAYYSIQARRII